MAASAATSCARTRRKNSRTSRSSAINDLGEPRPTRYMLQYDTAHGKFPGDVAVDGDTMIVNGDQIRVLAQRDPAEAAVGRARRRRRARVHRPLHHQGNRREHLKAGAKKVIISAPAQGRRRDDRLRREPQDATRAQTIISNASCTTNCLAPLAKVLNDKLGIERGLMTTVHATPRRRRPSTARRNKDWRGGRGILENIIPSTHRRGQGGRRGDARAEREAHRHVVPRADPDVSVVDLTFEPRKERPTRRSAPR